MSRSTSSELLLDLGEKGVYSPIGEKPDEGVGRNPALVTALNPEIGYGPASDIAREAHRIGRPMIDVAEERSGLDRRHLETLMDPLKLRRVVWLNEPILAGGGYRRCW